MSTSGSIKTSGADSLSFYFDITNVKSYAGEPTTNIIPSPTYNAIPTIGNGWGTYNTNQYNSATYFSIGTISSVSSNIVTTSGNHPLRTYDVVTPQTTGGGVTAGTNYFVKKLSNTTFTLHSYNSSQDGSQGYINSSTGNHKVWDDISNDVRVSINSSSFPTMWWGPPHLPNSGIVKEIIPDGFDAIPGKITDCLRLHYSRPDGVTDGMSYNVDCTVTPGSAYTVSFWSRSADAAAVGKQIQYQNYNYTGGSAAGFYGYFNLGPVGVWQKQSFTFTYTYGTIISYWFSQQSGPYRWDLSNIQVEQKSHSTPFTTGTRALANSFVDIAGGASIDGNLSYDSNATPYWNGPSSFDYLYATESWSHRGTNSFTYEAWFKHSSDNGYDKIIVGKPGGHVGLMAWGGTQYFRLNSGGFRDITISESYNTWYHLVGTYTSGVGSSFYRNGVLIGTNSFAGSLNDYGTVLHIGGNVGWNSNYSHNAYINIVKVYQRALNASEVLQNFNAHKSRFGL